MADNKNHEQIIIGLVGEKFSGKDTVSNFLVKKHRAYHIRFTHILDDILRLLNLPISRQNEIDLGLGLRQIFDPKILGRAVAARVKDSKAKMVVINGIRMDEMANIKKLGAKIVYITARPEVRFKRYKRRHEKTDDGVMDYRGFLKQEQGPTEVGIPKLGQAADYKIVNEGSIKQLDQKINRIIQEI